ncbi:MAG: hypothetical protein ACK4MQ_11220 [Hyphomonas sp.]
MKHLFASCAAAALLAAPAFAQSTNDPTDLQRIPVEPGAEQVDDLTQEFQPQTDIVPETEWAMEDDGATDVAESDEAGDTEFAMDDPPAEEREPVLEADISAGDQTLAEADTSVDTGVSNDGGILEATVDTARLPETYSTDDLNAIVMAEMNDVSVEIAGMNVEPAGGLGAFGSGVTDIVAEGDADYPEGETGMFDEPDPVTQPEADPWIDEEQAPVEY